MGHSKRTRSKPMKPWFSTPNRNMSMFLLALLVQLLQQQYTVVQAHPPPPSENDIFGTVTGCASALIEMDDNQDGMIKRGEYLDFVNTLADFLCVPPRPIMDLEIQTVFFSIACLCQEREGFDVTCCFGNDAAIFNQGAADGLTRTEDQDSYLRAACLLTQAILGPPQCTIAPNTLSPAAVTLTIARASVVESGGGLSDSQLAWIIAGILLLLLLCCLLLCCLRRKKKEDEEEEALIVEEEEKVVEEKSVPPPDEEKANLVPVALAVAPEEHSYSREPKEPPKPDPEPVAPPILPVPYEESEDEEEEDDIGRKMGETESDDEDDENKRRFGGVGMLPNDPEPEGVVLRHVVVEKPEEGEYEYPEREMNEYKAPPDDDSVQEFEPYVPDSGVHIPVRPEKPPVVFNPPKYERQVREVEEFDPRKWRKQLGLGDGEVWESLAAHEEERATVSKENRFEWVVQGALDVLAKANDSGELTKPKPPNVRSVYDM